MHAFAPEKSVYKKNFISRDAFVLTEETGARNGHDLRIFQIEIRGIKLKLQKLIFLLITFISLLLQKFWETEKRRYLVIHHLVQFHLRYVLSSFNLGKPSDLLVYNCE